MEAFEDIVKDHSPKLYYFLRRMGLDHEDTDELLQDVFVLFWRDLKNGRGLDDMSIRLYQHAVKNVLRFLNKSGNILLVDNGVQNKLVFVLKHHEGFDFIDIAEMTGWDISIVRSSFKSALTQLG